MSPHALEIALVATIAIPLAMALLLGVLPIHAERAVARCGLLAAALSAGATIAALAGWAFQRAAPVHTAPHVLFSEGDYRFTFELVFDATAVVFLVLVQLIGGLVMRFSRYYLHREPGFRRFFATVLLFQSAMCLLTLAGNLDLMFAGWEAVGLSSFLLIAFYRERQSPVRNALKTYSVYRIADVGMLLAVCIEGAHGGWPWALGLCLLLAAMGKSAQFPFSFWVARAMEGPTPSSALFYGALSVHAGAYLLLRTFPLWGALTGLRVCVGVVGLATAVLCSMFSRVQPTIKAHIGYASVTQVGLIFFEIALGLTHLALLHTVSNAFLRCYQLLVSPSVVAHRLRRQATAGAARVDWAPPLLDRLMPGRWRATIYVFAMSEGYSRELLKSAVWFPLRRYGRAMLRRPGALAALGIAAASLALAGRHAGLAVPAGVAVLLVASAFSARALALWQRPARAIGWLSASCLLCAVAACEVIGASAQLATSFYAFGVALSYALGAAGLALALGGGRLAARFSGLWATRPLSASLAFVGALGIAGFPVLPTFWGEELMVHGALGRSPAFAAALAAMLGLNGYLTVRNFAFTFFGVPGSGPAQTAGGPLVLRHFTGEPAKLKAS